MKDSTSELQLWILASKVERHCFYMYEAFAVKYVFSWSDLIFKGTGWEIRISKLNWLGIDIGDRTDLYLGNVLLGHVLDNAFISFSGDCGFGLKKEAMNTDRIWVVTVWPWTWSYLMGARRCVWIRNFSYHTLGLEISTLWK